MPSGREQPSAARRHVAPCLDDDVKGRADWRQYLLEIGIECGVDGTDQRRLLADRIRGVGVDRVS